MSVKVTLKYGKKKIKNVEIKGDSSFEDFQGIIFSLIQVPPNRQKIISKGKLIEKDSDISKIKNKATIIVTGSAEKQEIKSDNKNIKFIEDLDDSQKQQHMAILPPGLHNLGNTCYLNSCLQCLKGIPELKNKLKIQSYKTQDTLSSELGLLFNKMDNQTDAVVPQQFVQFFRSNFPRFASRNPQSNAWEQQDADECLTEIFGQLRREMKIGEQKESTDNEIDNLFEGAFDVETKCKESDDEKVTNSVEKFLKLRCFIDTQTRHVSDGIMKSMSEEIEKRSEKLNRNAIWTKNATVSKLPKYLTVQFVRFYWKANKQKNAKIVRRVIFPSKLDAYPFCSKKLQHNIEQYRLKKLEKEDKKREKNQKVNINDDTNDQNKDKTDNNAKKDDKNDKNDNNNNNNNNNDKSKEQTEEKKESDDKDQMDVDKEEKDEIKEYETGYYELCGIVTHKGRSANSGHYIGYSKDLKRNKWLKFDDEEVSEMTEEDIKKLYGGGDWQMGFLCFYRKVEAQKV